MISICKKSIYRFILIPLVASYVLSQPVLGNPVVTDIQFSGLENTKTYFVQTHLKNKIGQPFVEQLWLEEKDALMDTDIFATVELIIKEDDSGTTLIYQFKELPEYLFFPAMKRTDQDGLLMGPGLVFMNLFGTGTHQELLSRFTVVPDPMKAKEFLTYTHIPTASGFPFESDLTVNFFDSYNSLKCYGERSVYSFANVIIPVSSHIKGILSLSSLNVRHDVNNLYFKPDSVRYRMFYGKGNWDFIPSAGAGFIFDNRERLMNPHRGIYAEGRYTLYGKKLGGDGDYSEYIGDIRGYVPTFRQQLIHFNFLGRVRPGTVPAYEFYHVGGVNSLRTFSPDASRFSQHELLTTIEYRWELFSHRQISLWKWNAYYGLQIIAGTDHAINWKPDDSPGDGAHYYSVYTGLHLLVPALERVRLEGGFNSFMRGKKEGFVGIGVGWYEKSETQRRRVR